MTDDINILDELEKVGIKPIKKGANWFIKSPWNTKDKNPSCCIYPKTNSFYDFSMDKGGDAYELLEAITGVSRKLPKFALINKRVAEAYQKELLSDPAFIKSMFKRGVTRSTIEYFGLGRSVDVLPILDEFGLFGRFDGYALLNEKKKSFFVNRFMFPIKDKKGLIIGFTGRTLSDDDDVKYLNTASLDKKKMLYNINKAIEPAKQEKRLYIVEGPFDVIAYWHANKKNVVSPLTCKLTPEQCELLKEDLSLRTEIVLAFDNDKAGKKGTLKAIQNLFRAGFYNVKLIQYGDKKDASEYIETRDEGLFDCIENTLTIGEYLRGFYDRSENKDEKRAILENIADSIAFFPPHIQEEVLKKFNEKERLFILKRIETLSGKLFKYILYQISNDKSKYKLFSMMINQSMLNEEERTSLIALKEGSKIYKNNFIFKELLLVYFQKKLEEMS